MDREQQIKTISAPSWEKGLRTKVKEVLAGLNDLGVDASPVTFVVQDITVHMALASPRDVILEIAEGLYSLRLPVAWLTETAPAAPAVPAATSSRK
jgi:hypothetical protein